MKLELIQRIEPRKEMFARVGKYVFCFGGGGSGFSEVLEKILTQHVSFAYMGSAEYEFGSAAKSLQHIHENGSHYVLSNATIKRTIDKQKYARDVQIYSPADKTDEIAATLKTLKSHETRDGNMWEWALKGDDQTTGWWDIKNHFMWFIDAAQAKFFQDLIADTDKYVAQVMKPEVK